nr:immunoglobulin light chain junction region [Macaca mulatta]
CQQYSNLPWTF